jgi:hypothetical protein
LYLTAKIEYGCSSKLFLKELSGEDDQKWFYDDSLQVLRQECGGRVCYLNDLEEPTRGTELSAVEYD